MKRHRHLWERVVGLPNLFAAAREALRGKRGREPAARRFARRYRGLLAGLRRGDAEAAAVTASVRAWIGHAAHAQSWGLRRAVLGAG